MKGSFTELFVKYFIILSKGNNKALICPSWHPHSTESQYFKLNAHGRSYTKKKVLSLFSIITCKYIKNPKCWHFIPLNILSIMIMPSSIPVIYWFLCFLSFLWYTLLLGIHHETQKGKVWDHWLSGQEPYTFQLSLSISLCITYLYDYWYL